MADGGSQAIWTSAVELGTSYWVFDGGAPTGKLWDQNQADYGFKFSDGLCKNIVIGDGAGIRTGYVVGHLTGVAYPGNPAAGGCSFGEKFFIATFDAQQYEIDNVTINNTLGIGWQNSVSIGSNGKPMKNWVIKYNVFLDGTSYVSPDAHGEDINEAYGYIQNTTIAYNLIKGRLGGTAVIAVTLNFNSLNTYIYGNVFSHDSVGNGVIAIGSGSLSATGVYVYDNTFDNITNGPWIGPSASGYTFINSVAEDNLLYNMAGSSKPSGFTVDYNAYYSTSGNRQRRPHPGGQRQPVRE